MTLTLGDLETQYRLYLTKSLCLEFPTPFNLWVICSLWIFVCASVAQWIVVAPELGQKGLQRRGKRRKEGGKREGRKGNKKE